MNQNIAVSTEKANYVKRFEDEAASLVEDAFAILDVADNVDLPDLAARYTGVAGVFCDTQSALDASGLRSRYLAGDALDLGVVETIDHNLSLRPGSRNFVLTEPVVPRSGRLMINRAKRTQTEIDHRPWPFTCCGVV
jgi:hypothetical protein